MKSDSHDKKKPDKDRSERTQMAIGTVKIANKHSAGCMAAIEWIEYPKELHPYRGPYIFLTLYLTLFSQGRPDCTTTPVL